MEARMNNPVMVLPGTLDALQAAGRTYENTGLPARTVHLVHLRASQSNGCSFCVEMHTREALDDGESLERLAAVAAWPESRRFAEADRRAPAATEAVPPLAGRPRAAHDGAWD